MKWHQSTSLLAIASISFLSPTTLLTVNAEPASRGDLTVKSDHLRFVQPQWEPTSAPGRTKGGGRRTDDLSCPLLPTELTALSPATYGTYDNRKIESVKGLTISANPTLWFYTPYTAPLQAEVEVVNDQNTPIYTNRITLPDRAGVIGIQLLTTEPLVIGKQYHWHLTVICNSKDEVGVDGWVERVALTTSKNNIQSYAQQGIWFDALTLLAEQRQKQPNNPQINADWSTLLEDVQLGDLANAQIVRIYPTPTASSPLKQMLPNKLDH